MLLLAAAIFFGEPVPMEMPRAEAYQVREKGVCRLEDRFVREDLWISRTVEGRWVDPDGRGFTLARLAVLPPAVGRNATVTRTAHVADEVRLSRKDRQGLKDAIERLSPVPVAEEPRRARQLPRGFAAVEYWQDVTNQTEVICAFLPEKARVWHLAIWELVEGDNPYERIGVFEDEFLGRDWRAWIARPKSEKPFPGENRERALLRADARHSVAAYPSWHVTDAHEFTVLDALPSTSGVVIAFTNELSRLRAAYAAALPSTIDGSNVLCVARIYGNRQDYLAAVPAEMAWSAGYWSPQRRELVTCAGSDSLFRTLRHEAFHQYLSYATGMVEASPWLNEGYAEYFEDTESLDWEGGIEKTPEALAAAANAIPELLQMDYGAFYSGTDRERFMKYRLAWSIAVFLEKGARKVRFDPFRDLKQTYMKTLLERRDMQEATTAAFGSEDNLKLFVAEWLRFWKER